MNRAMLRTAGLLLLAVALTIGESAAQPPRFRGGRFMRPNISTHLTYDGGFNFCRVMFRSNPYGDGGGWSVDYPKADVNLTFRLSELTSMTVSRSDAGDYNNVVLPLTCAITCCAAAFSGPTISGVRPRGGRGRARSERSCRRAPTRSSTCRSTTRCSTLCTT
jgi:hypothetical protein